MSQQTSALQRFKNFKPGSTLVMLIVVAIMGFAPGMRDLLRMLVGS